MTKINKQKISIYKLYICALLPIALGYSNYIINYLADFIFSFDIISDLDISISYQTGYQSNITELLRNISQLIVFTLVIKLLLSSNLFNKHNINIYKYKVNTIYLYIFICFVIGCPLILFGDTSYTNIAIAVIFGPIIEGITTQSVFSIIDDNKIYLTISILLLSSAAFALMHSATGSFTIEELVASPSIAYFKKYLQHFIYALYLSIITLYFKRIDIGIILHAVQNSSHFIV